MQVELGFDAILATTQLPQHCVLDVGTAETELVAGFGQQVAGRQLETLLQHFAFVEPRKARSRTWLGWCDARRRAQALDVAYRFAEQPLLVRIVAHRISSSKCSAGDRAFLCPARALPV